MAAPHFRLCALAGVLAPQFKQGWFGLWTRGPLRPRRSWHRSDYIVILTYTLFSWQRALRGTQGIFASVESTQTAQALLQSGVLGQAGKGPFRT